MRLLRTISAVLLFYFFAFFVLLPSSVNAATFRSGETVTVNEPLSNLYAAGGTVNVSSRTVNDLTVAGGTVRIEGDVTNSLLAAGGTLTLSGNVGNNARVAGGTVIIEAPIRNDLMVAGGTIDIDPESRIGGDLIITGGTVRLNAPVQGNVWLTGGQVEINNTVGGNVWGGEVGELRLGPNAVINGDLNYISNQRATIAEGATVSGKQNFKQLDRDLTDGAEAAGTLAAGTMLKLISSILIALFFVWLLPKFFRRTNEIIVTEPLKTGLYGFATLILMPILSVFLLIFLWLSIASFLLYFLILILSVVVVYLFVGWWVLRWWYGRDKKVYALDWKAAIVGPVITTILWFIPVIGWAINFILWLLGIGALMTRLWEFVTIHRESNNRNREARTATVPVRTTPTRSSRTTAKRKR